MPHQGEAAVATVGQRRAVHEGQFPVRVLVDRLEGVGNVAAVLEVVDPP